MVSTNEVIVPASERRRVLIAARPERNEDFRSLFRRDPLDQWVPLETDSFTGARFMLQHDPCDVLLVHDDLYEQEGGQGLAWLAWQREVPIVLLVGKAPERYVRAHQLGISLCLPSDLALGSPAMLASGLEQAMSISEARFGYRRVQDQLAQSRRHTDRLVNLLWRATPRAEDQNWFSQRYMLERLSEELTRTERHGLPLTVALGEISPGTEFPGWATDLIVRAKRRCDLAGHYGMQGFLLLMVQTRKEGGLICCQRLQKILEHGAHGVQPPHRPVETYFGVASLSPDCKTSQAILRSAEEKLQAARANPKERIAVA